jgi:hypothetical protein
MIFALVTQLLAVGVGCSACSVPDTIAAPSKTPALQASVAVASDSACRVLDVKLDKTVSVVFPDRATCGAGLTLIRGGTPSGDPKGGVATILIRILNHAAVTAQEPVRLTLAPGGVQIVGKGTPSNVTAVSPDSNLAGGVALWRIGPAAVLAAGDSTIVDTIKIGFVSPAKEAKLTFGLDATTVNPVPAVAPDSTPAWFRDDSSWTDGTLKRVLAVYFVAGTSVESRTAALDSVGARVVGGNAYGGALEGAYYVYLPNAATYAVLEAAIEVLERQPQVAHVILGVKARRLSRRPKDHPTWSDTSWKLNPDSASGTNWPQEAVAAPLGWGCSTGDSATRVAIIDFSFEDDEYTLNRRGPLPPPEIPRTRPTSQSIVP